MTGAIELERPEDLLVVVRFRGSASDAEFEQYLAEYAGILASAPRLAAVYVTSPDLPLTPPRQVRKQARFMKQQHDLIQERVVGVAFALPSPLARGVLRAVLTLQPMPCPHTVLATEAEGMAWVKARLWTDHVRRMKSPL